MSNRFKFQTLATRGLIFGAVLIGVFSLAILGGGLPDASADGTIPALPTPILNTVTIVNKLDLPDRTATAASPDAPVAVDICNQLPPYSDGNAVEELADIVFDESRELGGLPNDNYDWRAAVAGTNCTDVLVTMDRIKLINGAHVKYILQTDADDNIEVITEMLERGGGIIYLPVSAVSPDAQ